MMIRRSRVVPAAAVAAAVLGGACGELAGPTPAEPAAPAQVEAIADRRTAPLPGGELAEAARAYVEGAAELTDAGGGWRVRGSGRGAGARRHVRLQQLHRGVRVWGGDLIAHASATELVSVKGNRVRNLDGLDVEPVVTADEALRAARDDYRRGAQAGAAPLAFAREATELVILPQPGGGARLAWLATFFTELQGGREPGLWSYFIDAKTGAQLRRINAIHTLAQASGPGGNVKTPGGWASALDVEPLGDGTYAMQTARLATYNLSNATSGGAIVTGPLSPIGDAAINDAHGFAERTLDMLSVWMDMDSIDDNGFVITSRVHYGVAYDNAFWDGTQVTYGDGGARFLPLSGAIDVVAHEIGHGLTAFHSQLIYDDQSGGLNESFSDIAGTVAEFFDRAFTADFHMARDVFKTSGALRYMCVPTQDGISIDHVNAYTDELDVHRTSGIMNKAFCRAVRRFASGSPTGAADAAAVHRVGTAFFEANRSEWTASSTFVQGCQGVIDAAVALGFTVEEIGYLHASWADTGVVCTKPPQVCDETFTTPSGAVTSPNFPAAYPPSFQRTYCIRPADGIPVTVAFPSFYTEGGGVDPVKIIDGATGTVLTTASGTVGPAPTTSAFLAIEFKSNYALNLSGWRAVWTRAAVNQPPAVELAAPAPGTQVVGAIAIKATASDPDSLVARVVFTLPGGAVVEDTAAPFRAVWDTTAVADGTHTITAQAFDVFGAASPVQTLAVAVVNSTVACPNGLVSSLHDPLAIPDANAAGIASVLPVLGAGTVGTLRLSLDITHDYRGDLVVALVAPNGQEVIVHNRTGTGYDLVLANVVVPAFAGVPAAGPWTLRVKDLGAGHPIGTLNHWSIAIESSCAAPGDFAGSAAPHLPLVNYGSACSTLTVTGGTGSASAVRLDVAGTHSFRSILRGTLSHNGTTVAAFPTGTFPSQAGAFALTNRAVAGLAGDVNGTWTLCIVDTDVYSDTGVLDTWSVHD